MTEFERNKLIAAILAERAGKPTTLDAAVEKFLSDLLLTDTQRTRVASRQDAVRETIKSRLGIPNVKTYLVGSYPRETQIREVDGRSLIDVDCLFILPGDTDLLQKYYWNGDGGRRLLEEMHSAIDGYQGLKAKVDWPCVTLAWADMKMELTPAFKAEDPGYVIPGASIWEKWQTTDPLKDEDLITKRNQAANGDFKKLIRMLKCWNRTHGRPISSFAIEAVAYQTTSHFENLLFEASWFFKQLLALNGTSVPAPSKVGKYVKIQLDHWETHFVSSAKTHIDKAIDYAAFGRHEEAIALLGSVFGKPFPGVK